jgi:hypothetical protein
MARVIYVLATVGFLSVIAGDSNALVPSMKATPARDLTSLGFEATVESGQKPMKPFPPPPVYARCTASVRLIERGTDSKAILASPFMGPYFVCVALRVNGWLLS